jgi:hypothetical protein
MHYEVFEEQQVSKQQSREKIEKNRTDGSCLISFSHFVRTG